MPSLATYCQLFQQIYTVEEETTYYFKAFEGGVPMPGLKQIAPRMHTDSHCRLGLPLNLFGGLVTASPDNRIGQVQYLDGVAKLTGRDTGVG